MNPRTAIEINTGILEEARMNSSEENLGTCQGKERYLSKTSLELIVDRMVN